MDIEEQLHPYGVPDELIQQIRELVVRDPLTGLFNRRFFTESLAQTSAVAERYNQPLSLILFDLDHFKSINDQYGYSAGDQALKHFADALIATCREADIACRYGGDEFAVILPNTTRTGAEKLRHRMLAGTLAVSAGIAARPDPNLFASAEMDLRRQKQK